MLISTQEDTALNKGSVVSRSESFRIRQIRIWILAQLLLAVWP